MILLEEEEESTRISEDERWRRSVQVVLSTLAPNAKGDTPHDWALSIQDEMTRLRKHQKLARKAALNTLEMRLEAVANMKGTVVVKSNLDVQEQIAKKVRQPSAAVEHKLTKKSKQTRKRSRDFR